MPKNFTTAKFRHPVSKSWLSHCPTRLSDYFGGYMKSCFPIPATIYVYTIYRVSLKTFVDFQDFIRYFEINARSYLEMASFCLGLSVSG